MAKNIINSVRSTARGLHEAGIMDAVTLCEFDTLCLSPVKSYSAAQIKRIRTRNNASRLTIQRRESGQLKHGGASLKLLNLIDNNSLEILA